MVIFNIIHPAEYLAQDIVAPANNSITTNKIGVMDIAQRDEPIQHLERV